MGRKSSKSAEELLKEAIRLTVIQLGRSHPKLIYTLSALGKLCSATLRFAEAQALYRGAWKYWNETMEILLSGPPSRCALSAKHI